MADGATRVRVRGGVAEAIGLADARPRLAIGDWRLAIGLRSWCWRLRPSPFALRSSPLPTSLHRASRASHIPPGTQAAHAGYPLADRARRGARGALYPKPSSCGAESPPEGANGRVSAGHVVSKAGSYAAGNRESGQIRKEAALSEVPGCRRAAWLEPAIRDAPVVGARRRGARSTVARCPLRRRGRVGKPPSRRVGIRRRWRRISG